MNAERACEGGRVLEAPHNMAECIVCGRCVRWDLQAHWFFGWQNTCGDTSAVPVVAGRGVVDTSDGDAT